MVIILPTDGLAPKVDMTSAATMMTKFRSRIYTGPAFEGISSVATIFMETEEFCADSRWKSFSLMNN